MAILAGGLVIGVGGSLTLAAWVDTEWVFGGNANGDGPGVGTSTFEVQQDVSNPYASPGAWADEEANPGGVLSFAPDALAMTPGDVVYAGVALSTTPGTTIDGDLQLMPAVDASALTIPATDGPGDPLWLALDLEVGYQILPTATGQGCSAATWASYFPLALVGAGDLSDAPNVGDVQAISQARGDVVHYCFQITLPDEADDPALQGLTVAPAWQFVATSD